MLISYSSPSKIPGEALITISNSSAADLSSVIFITLNGGEQKHLFKCVIPFAAKVSICKDAFN
jgi:hypothetical protein